MGVSGPSSVKDTTGVTFLDELGLYLQHRAKLVSAKGPTEVEGRGVLRSQPPSH